MNVALLHNHYNESKLEKVQHEMKALGAPTIRAIWSEMYETWMAVEGCHRLRAAANLGLTPTIEDVTNEETIVIQLDDENTEINVAEFGEELQDDLWKAAIVFFDNE